jgi:alkylated DNA repair dioxygenase AlkB
MEPEEFEHVLVTEYGPGAGIGWHRDKAVFGEVVGISLLSPCVFRMRREVSKKKWVRFNLVAEPRSAYYLSGPARFEWEHSIPQMDALRYSITFRNLRKG